MEGRIVEQLTFTFEMDEFEAIEILRSPEWDSRVANCEDETDIIDLVYDIAVKEKLHLRSIKIYNGKY